MAKLNPYKFFPSDVLAEDNVNHAEFFNPTCSICVKALESHWVRTVPKPIHDPSQSCFNHKGRNGRYSFPVSKSSLLWGKAFCKTCYREYLRNEEIPIPKIENLDNLANFYNSLVPAGSNPLGLTPDKIKNLILSQWIRLSEHGIKTISIDRTKSSGVTTLTNCAKCNKSPLACRCIYDEI